jgi:hypothetical protein
MKSAPLSKVRLVLMLASALCSCAPPQTARQSTKVSVREIPFELRNQKVVVPAWVGSSQELWLTLDNGMSFDGLLLFDAIRDSGFLRLRCGFRAQAAASRLTA